MTTATITQTTPVSGLRVLPIGNDLNMIWPEAPVIEEYGYPTAAGMCVWETSRCVRDYLVAAIR